MDPLKTTEKDESGVPNFKTSLKTKIRRAVFVLVLILLPLDITNLIQATNMSCFWVLSPTFQGLATIAVDLMLLCIHYPRKLTPKTERLYGRLDYGNIFWRFTVLALTLVWPVREIITTGQITQPVGNDCQRNLSHVSSLGRDVTMRAGGPGVLDLIPVLKVARARSSVCIAVSLFLTYELILSYNDRRARIRRDKPLRQQAEKAAAVSSTGTDIELSEVETRT
ncbi:hypothetical protein EMPS_11496 [Entomortierella parvispora]|uniref:Uncharacterized protein n=1 Tax=Entomortierella parvispora TaxID=205924 RepID=A0A9P3HLZ5_9FUNG|nr:hypothetical protein EMPS_11496 [Entomortierella parvispora]